MGTKTKNSSKKKTDMEAYVKKLDAYIRMHFDQINSTMLSGFMRFEAMIEVLLDEGVVDKEKYGQKLKEIFLEMENNMKESLGHTNEASEEIDLSEEAVAQSYDDQEDDDSEEERNEREEPEEQIVKKKII